MPPTARRRGSPVLRRPDPPTGRSGVSQVTGPSSLSVPLATHPAGLPLTRLRASGNAAFQAENPLSTGMDVISGLTQAAHSFAWLRFNRLLTKAAASLATSLLARLWLGGARTHRTTNQSFGLQPNLLSDRHCLVASFSLHPQTSSPTGVAWSLPAAAFLTG